MSATRGGGTGVTAPVGSSSKGVSGGGRRSTCGRRAKMTSDTVEMARGRSGSAIRAEACGGASSARTRSSAVWNRVRESFARQRMTMADRSGSSAIVGVFSTSGVGTVPMCWRR